MAVLEHDEEIAGHEESATDGPLGSNKTTWIDEQADIELDLEIAVIDSERDVDEEDSFKEPFPVGISEREDSPRSTGICYPKVEAEA